MIIPVEQLSPFKLFEYDGNCSLILSDRDMSPRFHIFDERADAGWSGNGYDWASVARVVLTEQFPQASSSIKFFPEAGMFSAHGSRAELELFGSALAKAFANDDLLRDLLSRAEID